MTKKNVASHREFDVVVVGSGAGGSASGWALANQGKSVCIVERGWLLKDPEFMQDEEQMIIHQSAHENREICHCASGSRGASESSDNGRGADIRRAAAKNGGTYGRGQRQGLLPSGPIYVHASGF